MDELIFLLTRKFNHNIDDINYTNGVRAVKKLTAGKKLSRADYQLLEAIMSGKVNGIQTYLKIFESIHNFPNLKLSDKNDFTLGYLQ